MIKRISRRLRRILVRNSDVPVNAVGITPLVHRTTHTSEETDFYTPLLAGAATLFPRLSGASVVREVMGVLGRLTPDRYSEFLMKFYEEGLSRFGEDWQYADINTVLLGISRDFKLQSYMEIGVRRGRSMAMVAAKSPACSMIGFDLWIRNYAGMENPGKELVRSELQRVGFTGSLEFVDGDSTLTVPAFFESHPETFFDVITVDGDHSTEGARRDITNVIPRIKIGGGLVFDDIAHHYHRSLGPLWKETVVANPQFSTISFEDVGFGVGLGIRKF